MSSGEKILNWVLGKELGSGHFAKVRLAKHCETGAQCAVKIIKKPTGALPPSETSPYSWPQRTERPYP
jgi:serine/threonine protein kinase